MKVLLKIILAAIVFLTAVFVVWIISRDFKKEKKEIILTDKDILDSLSLEQKIGQLFIIGIEGRVLTPETEKLIKEIHPGGILLLARNIGNKEQLKELVLSFQKIALEDTGLPLFVAVDQEGGLISRIDWVEKTSQSEIKNKEEAYRIGKKRGEQLKEPGVNLNLAPLLDITYPKDFIYERTFQKNSEEIKELAQELIRGQKESGILTCAKHFPGYGEISFNPEEELAKIETVPEISQFFVVPSEMIMASNVIYKELDENLPFAFSEKGIRFLKENINGDYLIISDDLAQNSLLDNFSLKDIVSLPIKAGVDMLIFSGWRMPVIEGVEALRQSGISEERINQSVLKIVKLKRKI